MIVVKVGHNVSLAKELQEYGYSFFSNKETFDTIFSRNHYQYGAELCLNLTEKHNVVCADYDFYSVEYPELKIIDIEVFIEILEGYIEDINTKYVIIKLDPERFAVGKLEQGYYKLMELSWDSYDGAYSELITRIKMDKENESS